MLEATKAWKRRTLDPQYSNWIRGKVLDVGCGKDCISQEMYPSIESVTGYDLEMGHSDAVTLPELEGETFDCIHASHLLEHLNSPKDAVLRWIDLLAPGGHIVVTIPEWGMYEQGVWPSAWNADHKTAWVVNRGKGCEEAHIIGVFDFLQSVSLARGIDVLLVRKCEDGFDPFKGERIDQTLGDAESAIEFVIRKLPRVDESTVAAPPSVVEELPKGDAAIIPPSVKTMIIQHMGLGDAMICNAITRHHVHHAIGPVGLFINPAFRESIAWMYRDLGESLVLVDAPPRPTSAPDTFKYIFEICDNWGGDVINDSMFRENAQIFAEDGERFDKCFYRAASLRFQNKFDDFYYERDLSIELPSIEGCILLHDDKKRGFAIDRSRIAAPADKIVTVDDIGASNIFALRRIIEEAQEIHVINSAFLNFVDFLEPKGRLYWHRYSRIWVGVSDPQLQRNWSILN